MQKVYEYLNKEDELNLLKRYRLSGDTSALHQLVHFNQLNIKMIVDKFFWLQNSTAIEYDDLISEANVMLIKSIEKFDLESNNRLVSYSTTLIRNGVLRFILGNDSTVRIPANQHFDKNIDSTTPKHTEPVVDIPYTLEPVNTYDEWFNNKLLNILLNKLSPEDKLIIEYAYGLNNKPKLKHKDIFKKYIEYFDYPIKSTKTGRDKVYICTRKKRIEEKLSKMVADYKTRI